MEEIKEVYILMADTDGTMRSSDSPIGVAVTSLEEAKRFVEDCDVGYSRSFQKISVYQNKDEAMKFACRI